MHVDMMYKHACSMIFLKDLKEILKICQISELINKYIMCSKNWKVRQYLSKDMGIVLKNHWYVVHIVHRFTGLEI